MFSRRKFKSLARLHRSEDGPNTVEWVLLVIVALIVLVGIYFVAQWALGGLKKNAEKVNTQSQGTTPETIPAMTP